MMDAHNSLSLSSHCERATWMRELITSVVELQSHPQTPRFLIFLVSLSLWPWFTVKTCWSAAHFHALTFILHAALTSSSWMWVRRAWVKGLIHVCTFLSWCEISQRKLHSDANYNKSEYFLPRVHKNLWILSFRFITEMRLIIVLRSICKLFISSLKTVVIQQWTFQWWDC